MISWRRSRRIASQTSNCKSTSTDPRSRASADWVPESGMMRPSYSFTQWLLERSGTRLETTRVRVRLRVNDWPNCFRAAHIDSAMRRRTRDGNIQARSFSARRPFEAILARPAANPAQRNRPRNRAAPNRSWQAARFLREGAWRVVMAAQRLLSLRAPCEALPQWSWALLGSLFS